MRKNARVEKVYDGDTIKIDRKIRGTNRVRINKVDTPEKGRPGFRKAADVTKRMVNGKKVTIEPVVKDKFGRLIANVYKDGKSVRARLKRQGF